MKRIFYTLGVMAMLYPFSSIAQQTDSIPKRDATDTSDRDQTSSSIYITDYTPLGRATTSVLRPIDGAIPGVQMTDGGGQPGASPLLLIRGYGVNEGTNQPLIILDGAPYNGNIAALNARDIESITILKDALATLPYGNRGGNGVVEIVTKKGKANGTGKLNIDARFGTTTRGIPDYDVLTSEKDYYELIYESKKNYGYPRDMILQSLGNYNSYNMPFEQLFDADGKVNPAATLKYHDSWAKELLRTGLKHDYTVSYSDKTEKSNVYCAAGYLNEQGYVRGASLERFNLTFNGTTSIKPWLSVGLITNVVSAKNRYNEKPGGYNAIDMARKMPPIYPVFYYDASGQRRTDPSTGQDQYDFGSLTLYPNSSIGDRKYDRGNNRVADLSVDNIYTGALSYNVNPYVEGTILKQFKVRVAAHYNITDSKDLLQKPRASIIGNTTTNATIYTLNQSLTWHPEWGDHHVNVVVANEFYKLTGKYDYMVRNGNGASLGSGSGTEYNSLTGHHATGEYDYKSRYFISAGFRRDNTSNIAPGVRAKNFWALGAGYAISEEPFLRNCSWINQLKLRATYGSQGIYGLSDNLYQYQALDYAYTNSSINHIIQPEKQHQATLGLDASLFGNRVTATIDVYNREAEPLLYVRNPASFVEHYMTVRNRGLELSLGTDVIRNYKSSWNVLLNLTHNSNTLSNVPDGKMYPGYSLLQDGGSLYDINIPEYAGVDPINGRALYYKYDSQGQKSTTSDYGSVRFTDYKTVGSAMPKVYGSLTNSISWKRFNCSFRLNFSIGGKYYDGVYQNLMNSGLDGLNWHKDILNRWTPQNTSSDIPAVAIDEQTPVSTRFITDASYLSIKNIYLAYNLINNRKKKASVKALSVYLTADNIWMFTARKGMDPLASFDGVSLNNYPPARTIMLGLHVGI